MVSLSNPSNESDDPFACFGDSSSSEEEGHTAEESASQIERRHLIDASNHKMKSQHERNQLIARDKSNARWRLPITSPKYEVFDSQEESELSLPVQRGKGLRALCSFACGEEIIREGAVMRIPNQQAASTQQEAETLHASCVNTAFQALSEQTQVAVCSLASSASPTTALGVYATNGFQLGEGETEGGLFLTISRINHSCRSNTRHQWRPDLQQMVIVTTRDIGAGDEICTGYGGPLYRTTAARRSFLQERFGFKCACEMCHEGNATGGDDRMRRIGALQDDLTFLAGTLQEGKEEAHQKMVECLKLLDLQGICTAPILRSFVNLGYSVPTSHAHVVLA